MAYTRTDMVGVDAEQLLLSIGRVVRARNRKAANGDTVTLQSSIELINTLTSTWLRDNPTVEGEFNRIMPRTK